MIAAPLPDSPPPVSNSNSATRSARSILGGASLAPALSTLGSTPSAVGSSAILVNGAKGFSVFQDTAGGADSIAEGSWDDLGTNKSRRRENEMEAVEWKGETMPMTAKKSGGGIGKLEVFRDVGRFSLISLSFASNTNILVGSRPPPLLRHLRYLSLQLMRMTRHFLGRSEGLRKLNYCGMTPSRIIPRKTRACAG